ncbi:MAG: hypothetical protein JWN46_827 [Acidimicrobiales bacterium]|nr:hypothetical protein [Acidimicrobiales bacterium]
MIEETDVLAGVLARLEQLEDRNAQLEVSNAELRAAAGLVSGAPSPAPPTAINVATGPVGRRQMLRTGLVGVAAAAAGAVLSDAKPAAAANGDPLVMGVTTNTSAFGTQYTVSGSGQPGLVITDTGFTGGSSAALQLDASASGHFTNCLHMRSDAPKTMSVISSSTSSSNVTADISSGFGIGLRVSQTTGYATQFYSDQGVALYAQSNTDAGAVIYGQRFQLQLSPVNGRNPPTGDTIPHSFGEFIVDGFGDVWVCVTGGTPGVFRKIAGPATAGAFHALHVPVRVYDSRPGTSPAQGPKTPLTPNTARTIDLTVNSSTVPAGATAAAVNVLLVNAATGNGNFTVWANGVTRPQSNTMVWGGTAQRFSTFAVTALDSTAKVQVLSSSTTDVVLDVVGYYR